MIGAPSNCLCVFVRHLCCLMALWCDGKFLGLQEEKRYTLTHIDLEEALEIVTLNGMMTQCQQISCTHVYICNTQTFHQRVLKHMYKVHIHAMTFYLGCYGSSSSSS